MVPAAPTVFVNGRDRSKVVDGVHEQVSVARDILRTFPEEGVPVYGVLCFVGPTWRPVFPRPLAFAGVQVIWPAKLVDLLKKPGTLPHEKMNQVSAHLADALKPA